MCYYIRLSGGAHGFANMGYLEASQAAKELGAVSEASLRIKSISGYGWVSFSTSFFNAQKKEVLNWSREMFTGQVFSPPREVSQICLQDRDL